MPSRVQSSPLTARRGPYHEVSLVTGHPLGFPAPSSPISALLLFGTILAHRRPLVFCRLTVTWSSLGCSVPPIHWVLQPDFSATCKPLSVLLAARHPVHRTILSALRLLRLCIFVSFWTPTSLGIGNIGEKVRSTVGMGHCRKCHIKYRGRNVYSLEALLAPRGKFVTTRQITQVERAGQLHCFLANWGK